MVRITAIVSLGVAVLIVAWLVAAATSDDAFAVVDGLLRGFLGDVIFLIATWAIWYHLLGRLRHVIWDLGYGMDVRTSEAMGLMMFIGATLLAILTFIVT